jgi:DNA-binding NarL/FixJ family response regulator
MSLDNWHSTYAGQRARCPVPDSKPIRVLSVDDHPLLRDGITAIIESQPDMTMIAHAATGREAIALFREHKPDITLMDLRLPDISGIDAIIAIREEFPGARIVVLTTSDGDVEIHRALAAGAHAYILKTAPSRELAEAIRQVHRGGKRIPADVAQRLAEHLGEERLTGREMDVLQHLSGGNSNRDIAERLFISEETVKVHVKHIMEKLGAADRTQAVAIAVRRGIIRL